MGSHRRKQAAAGQIDRGDKPYGVGLSFEKAVRGFSASEEFTSVNGQVRNQHGLTELTLGAFVDSDDVRN